MLLCVELAGASPRVVKLPFLHVTKSPNARSVHARFKCRAALPPRGARGLGEKNVSRCQTPPAELQFRTPPSIPAHSSTPLCSCAWARSSLQRSHVNARIFGQAIIAGRPCTCISAAPPLRRRSDFFGASVVLYRTQRRSDFFGASVVLYRTQRPKWVCNLENCRTVNIVTLFFIARNQKGSFL